ncbi:TraG family conjugative transposon ATPase [Christiangramia fulva]|uniref:TraG family conjugative transposon ATPase n=1 Tax=Christiangramia fulva TaxID=2126553 RepID=A0A2R3ZA96_9FLAO|nr:TraG family conjugative transposon ATPase [Christiangramia fulva]AVR47187.1 TraG family conjugative transposon ATPase [Christiangramia fulva]
MKINLRAYYPVIGMKENAVFLGNGSFCLAYRVKLPEIYSLSEADFEKIHEYWHQAFKTLPAGTVIHKQDVFLKRCFRGDTLKGDSFLSRATAGYFDGREYLTHDSFIFFSWPGNRLFNKAAVINPFTRIKKQAVIEEENSIRFFKSAVLDAVTYLNTTRGIQLAALKVEEVEALTNTYFNGFHQGVDTDIEAKQEELKIGENAYGLLAVNSERCFSGNVSTSRIHPRFSMGEISFHQGFLDNFGLEFPHDHVVNQILYLDDRSHWLSMLGKRREELSKSVRFGTQNKVILERIEQILSEINRDDQARIIRGQFNILYWSHKKDQLPEIGGQLKGFFKDMDIKPYQPNGSELQRYFLSSYFGFSSGFSNEDLYVGDLRHALCLWLNNTAYQDDSSGIIFNDRLQNIPVRKDVWDEAKKRIKARNFAIFAPTGEGKSFLANNILRQFFEDGTRLVIIDLGGSYSKFALLYPQEQVILRYEEGKNLGINPFYITDTQDLNPERIEDLTGFLLELTASGLKVAKEQQVALKKILLNYYRATPSGHSLESFFLYTKKIAGNLEEKLGVSREFFNADQFLHLLSEYVENGIYSFLFESREDQTYRLEDKKLIIFELDEVKDNRAVLSVMLKLIKSAVQRTIWKNRSERGIILFDEFAKQLKFENVLESVEFYYQAIRKQNGAIGIILQSVNQLPETAASASILENTQVIYSLHNEKGYEALRRRLNLTAHDLNQLHSIRNNLTGPRKYTEIFIKIGKQSNIFRLEVPPEVYAAYLTDGKENQEIMALYEQHGSMEKAIIQFLNQHL